jgi:hypothetical protein
VPLHCSHSTTDYLKKWILCLCFEVQEQGISTVRNLESFINPLLPPYIYPSETLRPTGTILVADTLASNPYPYPCDL